MKYKGKKVEGRNTELLVLRRPNGETMAFKCEAVGDYSEFEKICPAPEPPEVLKPGGVRERNVKAPAFRKALEEWAGRKTDYTVLKSLEASPDIEWDTVDIKDPNTWGNYRTEMTESGFTEIEVARVLTTVGIANCMDDSMLEAAREDFLVAEAAAEQKSVSPEDGPLST
jgi:hypothetical protein